MAQILKMLHFAQQHGVAQMQVGSGRVETGFHTQGPAFFLRLDQPLAQVLFADQFRQAFLEINELFVGGRRGHSLIVNAAPEFLICQWILQTAS